MEFLIKVLITAVAVWVATVVPGIDLVDASPAARIGTLVLVALVFGLVNAVIKPVVKLVGCLFYLLTLGLFGLVVNGLMFWLAGWISAELGLPFQVTGFWPAFWGAIIVALVSFALNLAFDRTRLVTRR
ncbi:phage holin family protein [Goodfellowiella coeruleoviolacea]|uniref:Membrane protein n=1 Tax=Goodfellowiella coeruleoviolacea TaxID=334858 RepID=A0AAE3GDU1_9PSEU|nr:phage holin family protein [Goodfellowiella coeruleoviolacea]MCP2166300.1 putative membrane protein [Goodfellowiella coeruleoviolacea]